MKSLKADTNTKILSRKVEFQGFRKLETIEFQHKSLRHGGWCEAVSREVYHAGGVVVALLYIPETDQILLNEQFRIGAHLAGDANPWLYECCAGIIDEGETPEEAVYREAKEETGCDVLDIEHIGHVYPSPGGMNETFHLYCARIAQAQHGGIFGVEGENEEIRTHLLSAAEVIRMLDEGQITNAGAVICLHWFARNKDRIRKKWS